MIFKEFRYIKSGRPILWLNGRPPLAEPMCGFHGELCPRKKLDWRYLVTAALFAFVLIAAIALLLK